MGAGIQKTNAGSDADPQILRISMGVKTMVKVVNLFRGGHARQWKSLKADDYHTQWTDTLVSFGILNPKADELTLLLGEFAEMLDFVADCLVHWWTDNQQNYADYYDLGEQSRQW